MTSIAIIDYGMGNLRSVAKAFEHVAPKQRVRVTNSAAELAAADRVVFPGQGAIGDCMSELNRRGLIETVRTAAATKPFLGLCLGPQALLDHSEENGGVDCLAVLPGQVRRFAQPSAASSTAKSPRFKVPHMGWSRVRQTRDHPLWHDIPQQTRFYFVHSYYLQPPQQLCAGSTCYALEFCSALAANNIFAVQFHPEKSARYGLQLLANFSTWDPLRQTPN